MQEFAIFIIQVVENPEFLRSPPLHRVAGSLLRLWPTCTRLRGSPRPTGRSGGCSYGWRRSASTTRGPAAVAAAQQRVRAGTLTGLTATHRGVWRG